MGGATSTSRQPQRRAAESYEFPPSRPAQEPSPVGPSPVGRRLLLPEYNQPRNTPNPVFVAMQTQPDFIILHETHPVNDQGVQVQLTIPSFGELCDVHFTLQQDNGLAVEREFYHLVRTKFNRFTDHFPTPLEIGETSDAALVQMRTSLDPKEKAFYRRWMYYRLFIIHKELSTQEWTAKVQEAGQKLLNPMQERKELWQIIPNQDERLLHIAEYLMFDDPKWKTRYRNMSYLVFPAMRGQALQHFLAFNTAIDKTILNEIAVQVAQALSVLASQKTMHNNLDDRHIFIETWPEVGEIHYTYPKICSLKTRYKVHIIGFDRAFGPNMSRNTTIATLYCSSTGQCNKYTPKFDWYTFLCQLVFWGSFPLTRGAKPPTAVVESFRKMLGTLYQQPTTPALMSTFGFACRCVRSKPGDNRICTKCEAVKLNSLESPRDFFERNPALGVPFTERLRARKSGLEEEDIPLIEKTWPSPPLPTERSRRSPPPPTEISRRSPPPPTEISRRSPPPPTERSRRRQQRKPMRGGDEDIYNMFFTEEKMGDITSRRKQPGPRRRRQTESKHSDPFTLDTPPFHPEPTTRENHVFLAMRNRGFSFEPTRVDARGVKIQVTMPKWGPCDVQFALVSPADNGFDVERAFYDMVNTDAFKKETRHFLTAWEMGQTSDNSLFDMRTSYDREDLVEFYKRWIQYRLLVIHNEVPTHEAWRAIVQQASQGQGVLEKLIPNRDKRLFHVADYLMLNKDEFHTMNYTVTPTGVTLQDFLVQGSIDTASLHDIAVQVAQALTVLASRKIMHNHLDLRHIFIETLDRNYQIPYSYPKEVLLETRFFVRIFGFDRAFGSNLPRNTTIDNFYCTTNAQCNKFVPKFDWFTFLTWLVYTAPSALDTDEFYDMLGGLYRPVRDPEKNTAFGFPCTCKQFSSDQEGEEGPICSKCLPIKLDAVTSPESFFTKNTTFKYRVELSSAERQMLTKGR